MKLLPSSSKDYFVELKRRAGLSRISKSYQLTGLEIADILDDWEHRSLYIKLAKEHGEAKVFRIAKAVAENKKIDNKGAYFMKVFYGDP